MSGKPQTLSQGQKDEVVLIIRNTIFKWILLSLTLLSLLTGLSLWGIKKRVETKMEELVAKQFEEPRVQQIVERVSANQASALMAKQIQPEVDKFKAEIANQLKELHALVATTQQLEFQRRKHEQSIQTVLAGLQQSLVQSQKAQTMLTSVRTDIVEMQKCVATIQYYQIKGADSLPNPYQKEMLDVLNKLVVIAIPNPTARNKFIAEVQGPQN